MEITQPAAPSGPEEAQDCRTHDMMRGMPCKYKCGTKIPADAAMRALFTEPPLSTDDYEAHSRAA